MAGLKKGKRHRLLIYRRAMDQMSVAVFWIGIVLGLMWGLPKLDLLPSIFPGYGIPTLSLLPDMPWYGDLALMIGLALAVVFTVFIHITRNMAFVQANEDYILVSTPFLRLRISYKRVMRVRPMHFSQVFTPDRYKGARKRLLEPFAGKTVIVIDLKSLPMSKFILHLFLLPEMFLSKETGMVFIVQDWMGLSIEMDSMLTEARDKAKRLRQGQPTDGYSLMQSLRRK